MEKTLPHSQISMTAVHRNWGDVIKKVRKNGSVLLINYYEPEACLVSLDRYHELIHSEQKLREVESAFGVFKGLIKEETQEQES